ncbi:carboxypeptidase regulatory-like domain-containing protein [Bacillus sp. C1]
MGFPTSVQFTPVLVNGNVYADIVGDHSPASTDIVGSSSFPSFYYAYDGVNIYFRLRLHADPRNSKQTGFQNFAWGVLFNTSGVVGTYQWLLNVDGNTSTVNLIQNVIEEFNSWNDPAEGTNGRGGANFSRPIVNFDVARVVQADSNFGGDPDYFLDFFIPIATLFSFLGITANSNLNLLAFTSANSNNYNKDSLQTAEGFQFQQAQSNLLKSNQGDVRAALSLEKTLLSGPTTIVTGVQGEWTGSITLTNIGKSTATTLFVNDVISLDILDSVQVTSVSLGTAVINGSTITWNVGNLSAGASATLQFVQKGSFITAGNRILNTATVTGIDSYSGGVITAASSNLTVTAQTTGGVTGTVTNGVTGVPIAGANVQVLLNGNPVGGTITDSAGSYSLPNITPNANYVLQITATNYVTSTRPLTIQSNVTSMVNVTLTPAPGNVQGTVIDGQTNVPIVGAAVTITNTLGAIIAQTTTNGSGQYVVNALIPGTYNIAAVAANYQSQTQAVLVQSNVSSTANFLLVANPGTIQGTVRDSATNITIAGANVTLRDNNGVLVSTTTTDGAGAYTFSALAPGSYRVIANAINYDTQIVGAVVSANQVTNADINLIVNPGSLSGTVIDSQTGTGVNGATIRVVNQFGITVATTQPNNIGAYTVPSLAPGTYSVIFAADGYGTQTVGAVIASNQVSTTNVSLIPLAGSVTGEVIDSQTNLPINMASVSIFLNNVLIANTITNVAGNYTFTGLTPGNYTVSFSAQNYGTQIVGAIVQANMMITVDESLSPLLGNLQGNVTGNNQAIAGAVLLVRDANSDVIVTRSVTDANGGYDVQNVAPGTYNVTVSAPDFQTSIKGITIAANATSQLNFILLPNPAAVTGVVTNAQTGTPIAGANIQIRVLDANGVVIASVFSDSNGIYFVHNLGPGTYSVIASADNFQTNITTVTLSPGETETTNIALLPDPGFITGTVRDAITNAPIAGAAVNISDSQGVLLDTVLTDNNGNVITTGLPPGIYTVTVIAQDYQNQIVGAIVSANTTTPISVSLQPNPGGIAGVINPTNINAIVQLYTTDNLFINSIAVDDNGNYQFTNLAPSIYIVKAAAPNYAASQAGATVHANQTAIVNLTTSPNPAQIQGLVQDSVGAPVINATVKIIDSGETVIATGLTDQEGRYSAGSIPPGIYNVIVTAPQFQSEQRGVSVEANQIVTNFDFTLQSNPGAISAQVTDRITGNPLAGATILIRDSQDVLVVSTVTSPFGNIVVSGLKEGSYTVTATAPNYSTEIIGAIVRRDETTAANLSLTSIVGDISGIVVDEDQNPVTGANIQIHLLNGTGVPLQSFLANPDGTFTVQDLEQGQYLLNVIAPNYAASTVSVIVEVNQTTNVTVPLTSLPGIITGTITDGQTGVGIGGSTVTVTSNTGIFLGKGITDENGNYTITNLPPGVLSITVMASSYGSVATTTTLLADEIQNVSIALQADVGTITGFVTDFDTALPIPGANVVITTLGNIVIATAVTDQTGRYVVGGLAPGSYRVIASESQYSTGVLAVVVIANAESLASFVLSPNPGFITGVVIEKVGGLQSLEFAKKTINERPLQNINILVRYLTINGPVIQTLLTDGEGRYITGGLAPGTYALTAFSNEYGDQTSSILVVRDTTTTLNFVLSPNIASLQGVVVDVNGLPLSDTIIRLFDSNNALIQATETNANGLYVLNGITPGEYTVVAIHPNFERQQIAFTAIANETATVNFALKGIPGNLGGAIKDSETHTPLAGALVEIFPSGSTLAVARRTTDGTGKFNISSLEPGNYTVVASNLNYESNTVGAIVVSGDTTNVEILLFPNPALVSGTVTEVNGNPINNAGLSFFNQSGILIGSTVTDVNGNYVMGGLPANSYTVVASAPQFAHVSKGLIVAPGQNITNFNFELTRDVGKIIGTITGDGIPLVGATVSLLEDNVFIVAVVTRSDGTYMIENVAPGVYTASASASGFSVNQVGAVLEANTTVEANIELSSLTGTIAGIITDTSGVPIANALVIIQISDIHGQVLRIVQADHIGAFVITGLAPGSYVMTASAPQYQTSTVGVNVKGNETANVTIQLPKTAGILTGTVVEFGTNKPIVGSSVKVININGFIIGTAVTDESGRFQIENLPVGTVNVIASAAGYASISRAAIILLNETVDVTLPLQLNPGRIVGTITNIQYIPVSGAVITIIDSTNAVITTVVTQNDGSYLVESLASGTYTIIVNATGYRQGISSGFVVADHTTEVSLQLIENAGTIVGIVEDDETHLPIKGADIQIRFLNPSGPIVLTTVTDMDGGFIAANLIPGVYAVTAFAEGYGNDTVSIQVIVNETANAILSLPRLVGAVRGKVTDTIGMPLVDTLIKIISEGGIVLREVQSDIAGNYLIDNIMPGNYTLVFINANYQNVVIPVTILANETKIIDVALQPNPASIIGTVVDANSGIPIIGAVIQVLNENGHFITNAISNVEGKYIINGLTGGPYTVVATMQGYIASSCNISLPPGGIVQADFSLVPNPASIQGRIVDQNGNPVNDAFVRVLDQNGNPVNDAFVRVLDQNELFINSGVSDGNGIYIVGNLPPGELRVVVSAAGFPRAIRVVTVRAGEQLENVDFILGVDSSGGIQGNVCNQLTKEPIANAKVEVRNAIGTLVTVHTDASGDFTVSSLAAGTYTLIISNPSYRTKTIIVDVEVGETTRITVGLDPIFIPPSPGKPIYIIFFKETGKALSIPCTSNPTVFQIVQVDRNRDCATFSYTDIVGVIKYVTLDLRCVWVMKI